MVEVVINMHFEVLIKKTEPPRIYPALKKYYVGATINYPRNTLKKHPQQLSSPVLSCGKDGQKYGDVVPQLCFGPKLPPADAAIGKHKKMKVRKARLAY